MPDNWDETQQQTDKRKYRESVKIIEEFDACNGPSDRGLKRIEAEKFLEYHKRQYGTSNR